MKRKITNESISLDEGRRGRSNEVAAKRTSFGKKLLLFFLFALFINQASAQPNCADVMGPPEVCVVSGN